MITLLQKVICVFFAPVFLVAFGGCSNDAQYICYTLKNAWKTY